MIEFLSNENWINPQLDFLTFLQTIRSEHLECLNKMFLSITILGEIWLPAIICSIIYWCVDTKSGIYLFSLFGFELIFSQLFKMIACVYRPWILSEKIHPVDLAVPAAKGYSFPSGHSATACSILGGLALLYRKNKILCIFLILTILSVGFSRLWLGVHTPQDVVVGLTLGLILVFLFNSLINWAEKNKKRYLNILIFADIFAFLALIYVCYFNQYPCDYINDEMLVNPFKSKYSFVVCYGFAFGLLNGAFLCRRFTNFEGKYGNLHSKIKRGIMGSIILFIILKFALGYIFSHIIHFRYVFVIATLIGLFVTFIYPLFLLKIQQK